MIHFRRTALRSGTWAFSAAVVTGLLLGGCVRRVHEAPGLTPGSDLAVGSSMRLETFEVEDLEVRSFQMPLSRTNQRRFQFVVLKQGIKQVDFMVQRLEDGTWALLEARTDGITVTRDTWGAEPAYAAARAAVVAALRGEDVVRAGS